jgi:hemerythrin-like domain-containing protein
MPKDAVTLLKEDHARARKLLAQLESARGPSRRKDLLERVAEEITLHTTLEEEIFYPAFHDAASRKSDDVKYFEALAEHNVVRIVIPDLRMTDAASDAFPAKAKVLKELVEHHAEEEEKELFPRARTLLGAEALARLGARLRARKTELRRREPPVAISSLRPRPSSRAPR